MMSSGGIMIQDCEAGAETRRWTGNWALDFKIKPQAKYLIKNQSKNKQTTFWSSFFLRREKYFFSQNDNIFVIIITLKTKNVKRTNICDRILNDVRKEKVLEERVRMYIVIMVHLMITSINVLQSSKTSGLPFSFLCKQVMGSSATYQLLGILTFLLKSTFKCCCVPRELQKLSS